MGSPIIYGCLEFTVLNLHPTSVLRETFLQAVICECFDYSITPTLFLFLSI